MTLTLTPTVVLLPQWLIDDIAKITPDVEEHMMNDDMRANGWDATMLAGGYLFIRSYRIAVNTNAAVNDPFRQ